MDFVIYDDDGDDNDDEENNGDDGEGAHQPPLPLVVEQSPDHRSWSLSRAENAIPLSILF